MAQERKKPASRAPALPRMSLTIDPRLRKAIRIAAAKADMEIGDWCKTVLIAAANRAVHRLYPQEYDEHGRQRARKTKGDDQE